MRDDSSPPRPRPSTRGAKTNRDRPSYGDLDFSAPTPELNTEATQAAVRAIADGFHRRLALELLAAWRAGYDGLDVVIPPAEVVDLDAPVWKGSPRLRAAFVPEEHPPIWEGWPDIASSTVERYDLTDLDADDADALRRRADR